MTQSIPIVGAAKPADFSRERHADSLRSLHRNGRQRLLHRRRARRAGSERGAQLHLPRQRTRAAASTLVDGTVDRQLPVPEGGIDLMNRGSMGSGHGAGRWVGRSPGTMSRRAYLGENAARLGELGEVGNRGEQSSGKMPTFDQRPEHTLLPQGIVESQGTPVAPASLYLEQLRERLGARALKDIGY